MAGVLGDTTCRCGKTARRAATLGRGLAVIGISGGRSAEPRQITNACDTLAPYLDEQRLLRDFSLAAVFLSVVAADGAPAANLRCHVDTDPHDRETALVQLGSSTSSAVPLGGTAPPLCRSRSRSR